MPDKDNDKESS